MTGSAHERAVERRCARLALFSGDGCRAALVVHGGVIMAICEAYAMPRRDFYSYHLPNGGLLRARYEGGTLTIL